MANRRRRKGIEPSQAGPDTTASEKVVDTIKAEVAAMLNTWPQVEGTLDRLKHLAQWSGKNAAAHPLGAKHDIQAELGVLGRQLSALLGEEVIAA